jgi:hypothetical protein
MGRFTMNLRNPDHATLRGNMKHIEEKGRMNAPVEVKPKLKKQYVKPEVRHERVFETMALTCGKMQSTEGSCHFVRKNS